jgi:hypothetical protein
MRQSVGERDLVLLTRRPLSATMLSPPSGGHLQSIESGRNKDLAEMKLGP